MRHPAMFLALALGCTNATNDPLDGTEVVGSPLCGAPVPCCADTRGALPSDALSGAATVGAIDPVDGSDDATTLVLTLGDETSLELTLAVPPDLSVGDTLEVTTTDLGIVLRDEDGIAAVIGTDDVGYGGAFVDAELAVGDETLRPVLACHGFVPHRMPEFCDDALIADYALELAGVSVTAGQQTALTVGGASYHLRNQTVRRRVSGTGRECADFWPPMLRFELVRRAK